MDLFSGDRSLSEIILEAIVKNDQETLSLIVSYTNDSEELFKKTPEEITLHDMQIQWERLASVIEEFANENDEMPTRAEIIEGWRRLFPSIISAKQGEKIYKNSKNIETPSLDVSTMADILKTWGFSWIKNK